VIPTRRHLQYAAGFLELGMLKDAARELRAIDRADQDAPEVLSARLDLTMQAKQWKSVRFFARKLARIEPENEKGWISWAYALRELNRVEEAKRVLLEAEPVHGKNSDVLHYNLACYDCLLGNLPEAKRRLTIAAQKDKQWKEAALSDPDLKALWTEIGRMEG
jgi:Flp pilus assembly protein TadD